MKFPTPVFDANAAGGKNLGNLPEWDLTDLYPAPDSEELKRDMAWLEKECAAFAVDYEGKLATLDAAGLLKAVQRYEEIDIIAGRIMSFAGLHALPPAGDPDGSKQTRRISTDPEPGNQGQPIRRP